MMTITPCSNRTYKSYNNKTYCQDKKTIDSYLLTNPNFYFNLVYRNSAINPNVPNYLSYFTSRDNGFFFSKQISAYGKV
jgi:hypothetical protein